MRIALTGGCGFIGQEIASKLLDNQDSGHEVIIVDFWKDLITSYEKARYPILTDIYRTLSRASAVVDPYDFLYKLETFSPHVIIHAGAVVDTKDIGDGGLWQQNVEYTDSLVREADKMHDALGIVFLSSAATYGSGWWPNNPYGFSKVLGEKIVQASHMKTRCLRLFNVFGQNEHHKGDMASVPWKLAQSYKSGNTFSMHDVDASRDFIPVTNVANAVCEQAFEMPKSHVKNATYDVGTGVSTSFSDVDNFIMQAKGYDRTIVKVIDRPADLNGRYQTFTQAGVHGVKNIGAYMTTRTGIEVYYGK